MTAIGWSREEVEATVADYFAMLDLELDGIPYNKSEHRRMLSTVLRARSGPAIERKRQNISAILLERRLIYIPGYKPLGNVQHLLRSVVVEQLERDPLLVKKIRECVERSVTAPSFDDILDALEPPPIPSPPDTYLHVKERNAPPPPVDYLALEAANAALGEAGEEFALAFERARLIQAGCGRLVSRIEHVSKSVGDWLGYDIRSCEVDGSERLIEVKTTGYGKNIPFYVSRNEVLTSIKHGAEYHLYRVFQFRANPRLYQLHGSLTDSCRLDPIAYEARVG